MELNFIYNEEIKSYDLKSISKLSYDQRLAELGLTSLKDGRVIGELYKCSKSKS